MKFNAPEAPERDNKCADIIGEVHQKKLSTEQRESFLQQGNAITKKDRLLWSKHIDRKRQQFEQKLPLDKAVSG